MWKPVPSKLFQEQMKDFLYSTIETSEIEIYELDSLHKLKNCMNNVEKLKKHHHRQYFSK